MISFLYDTTIIISSTCEAILSRICSRIGLPMMEIIGFGIVLVKGLRRVHSPPARIIAFIIFFVISYEWYVISDSLLINILYFFFLDIHSILCDDHILKMRNISRAFWRAGKNYSGKRDSIKLS